MTTGSSIVHQTTASPLAGKPAPASILVNVPALITAYYAEHPHPDEAAQRVSFGTSGHRGTSFTLSFNEDHVLAIAQAICLYRRASGIDGPLFLGWDTHALSEPARISVLEVLAANDVAVMVDVHDNVTPTPVISRAIVTYNRQRTTGLADGIVVTPSHNPPEYGGLKYDPPSGGPADSAVTDWIQGKANALLEDNLRGISRMPLARVQRAANIHRVDYLDAYVGDLANVIDMSAIRGSTLSVGIEPLGGASLRYWEAIAERYGVELTVVNSSVDPTFGFMDADRDGAIRMDPSSPYAMQRIIDARYEFDLVIANDPDADRYGVVTNESGLLPANHSLAAAVWYLFRHRPEWPHSAAVGKTIATSSIIDRVAARLGRRVVDVPVGFKYFVEGLRDGTLGVAGEESAGGSFLRREGGVWCTDKDGIIMGLLAMESMACTDRDPGAQYDALVADLGDSFYARIDVPASAAQKRALSRLRPSDVAAQSLADDAIQSVVTTASGNHEPIGGIKVATEHGWFVVRPSGTEAVYKLYAESFRGPMHLWRIQSEAGAIIQAAIAIGEEREVIGRAATLARAR